MKGSKKLLVFSILCIVAGLILAAFSGVRDGGYLKQLLGDAGNARLQEKKTLTVTEDFHSLRVKEISADVQLLPSEDGGCRVVWGEDEYSRCKVGVENGVLTVERETENRARSGLIVYEDILPVCIYLPEGSYRALSVTASSSDISSQGSFTWETAAVKTGSGEITLLGAEAESFLLQSTSGDIRLEALAAEDLDAGSGSGDIRLKSCSAASLKLESTSGDLRADKVRCSGDGLIHSGSGDIELEDSSFRSLVASASSGNLSLSRTVCSGSVDAQTDSGDIRLRDAGAESFRLRSSSGDVRGSVRGSVDFIVGTTSGSVRTRGGVRGAAECRVETGSGDVDLEASR